MYILVQVVSNNWFLFVCTSLLFCTHYMYMYSLVLMIPSFTLVFPIFVHVLLHVCVNSCLKLINIHIYLWVTCLHANYIMDSFVLRICMYIVSFDRTYIYLEGWFLWFHICLIKRNSCLFWALLIIFMKMLFTWLLCTHTSFVYSWHYFHEIFELYRFRVSTLVYLACFMRYIWFGFMFEGFLTSFLKITLN